jgi:hypothetical protein
VKRENGSASSPSMKASYVKVMVLEAVVLALLWIFSRAFI